MLWIFFQRSSFHWGSHPKLSFLQFSVREELTVLWYSEVFELLLKEKVPKRGPIETLKHIKPLPQCLFSSSSFFSSLLALQFWIQNILCYVSWTEFFFDCSDTVLSCKNKICCPTSRCIFCSCAVFSSSLLFMSINRYRFNSPSTNYVSW